MKLILGPGRLAFPLFLLVAAPSLSDEVPSLVVITDTPAYCEQLAHQVEARHSSLADVQRLLLEGREMCGNGEVRGGIRRLRRAMLMLHHRVVRESVPGPQ